MRASRERDSSGEIGKYPVGTGMVVQTSAQCFSIFTPDANFKKGARLDSNPKDNSTQHHGFAMPDFCFQYDLSIQDGRVNGARRQRVYEFIDAICMQQGYQRYQQSCWRVEGPSGLAFHLSMLFLASATEARFGANAFRSFHYEQRFNFVQIR